MDGEVRRIHLPADRNRGTLSHGIIKQRFDAIEVRLIHDLGDALLLDLTSLVIKILRNRRLEAFHQSRLLIFLDEDIVRRNAGLATIKLLGARKVCGDLFNVRPIVHDDRRLATEFQRDARQMLGSGRHHNLADAGRAGEENVADRQLQQCRRDADIAFKHGDFIFIEHGTDQGGRDARRRRAKIGQLHHAAIASGHSRGHRTKCEAKREVPWPEDEADAACFIDDLRRICRVAGGGDLCWRHPVFQTIDIQLDVADDVQHLRHADFRFGLARIFQNSRHDSICMGFDCRFQLGQLFAAVGDGRRFDRPLMVLLQGKDAGDILGDVRSGLRGAGHKIPA